jgi:NAD(P)H-hydrate epimerase
MFGYKPTIYLPKPGSKDIYKVTFFNSVSYQLGRYGICKKRLQAQCDNMEIATIAPSLELDPLRDALAQSDVILDAIFGFSFKPPIRAPFDFVLPLLSSSGLPIVSVDVPSGWDVEAGNAEGVGLNPDVLVSLTAPKEGVRTFTGRHFLGGRFVPK